MRTNVKKGRPLFHGFLKSDYGASSSSQVDPEESNEERKLEEQERRKLEHSARAHALASRAAAQELIIHA
ncbi:hypothetical protein PIB30_087417 [Stylosanthes scabra]|uniref:Uncharacterized protein n=1 Tax=Stylosanthes scabra TaxID=79078 RepID=A0ABU6ZS47_9FABA|nr:hypothetical protein [Stylosanthes scabra]